MEIQGTVHCLFEQSGTFKNEFRKLGFSAYDYDIQNDFGETDNIIDLFLEIERAYKNEKSIFDSMEKDDLIIAFFPCIYFCENNVLFFNGKSKTLKRKNKKERSDYLIKRSKKRQYFYEIALQLFTVCDVRGLRLIVENPFSKMHYLINNFPYAAQYIDYNRTRRGDYFNKPTQFWFINCRPTLFNSAQRATEHKSIERTKPSTQSGVCSKERSMISPDYARNFICDNIIGKRTRYTIPSLFD